MQIRELQSFLAATCFLALSSGVMAQQPQNVRIRGMIEKIDGNVLAIKTRDNQDVKVTLADNARVLAFVKASLQDIKPSSYIGVTAMPQSDGSQRAIAIHIFMEHNAEPVRDIVLGTCSPTAR